MNSFSRCTLAVMMLLTLSSRSLAQMLDEDFSSDPVLAGRFQERTNGTESSFTYDPTNHNLRAVLDVDNSPAHYISAMFSTTLTATNDAFFQAEFTIDSVDDQNFPTVYLGLMTEGHVNFYGDGVLMVLTFSNGIPCAYANMEAYPTDVAGECVILQMGTPYRVYAQYSATTRTLALDLFSGQGYSSFVGRSSVAYPLGADFGVNRIGIQNEGHRVVDQVVGSVTLTLSNLHLVARQFLASKTTTVRVSEVQLSWKAEENAVYQLQYCTDLASGSWVDLGHVQRETCASDAVPAGEARRFYRVVVLP